MPRDANVYQRPGRPHWFVVYYCPQLGKRIHKATAFRIDDPTGKRRALQFAAEKSTAAIAFRGSSKREIWNAWVPRFLNDRYRVSPLTLTRYANAWAWLHVYLEDHRLYIPAAVTYEHVINYIPWRTEQKRACGKPISRNTAIVEIKVFHLIMQEAVRRDFCLRNPCEKLRLRREPPKKKPELSDAEIELIRAECRSRESHLPLAEQWMTTSFEIALHQWCRLSSTQIPMHLVDLERGELTLRVKGRKLGEPSYLVVPIHPDLRPRLEALKRAGAAFTCQLPRMAAQKWWHLRQEIGIGHTAFHSTRVTGLTRARRAGVPKETAMRLAGHNSPVVHEIYVRETTRDLARELSKVAFSPPPHQPPRAPTGDAPQIPGGPATS